MSEAHLRRMEAGDLPSAMEIDASVSAPAVERGDLARRAHEPLRALPGDRGRGRGLGPHRGPPRSRRAAHHHDRRQTRVPPPRACPRPDRRRARRLSPAPATSTSRYARPTWRPSRSTSRSASWTTGRRPRYYGDEDALLMTLNLDRDVLRTPALLAPLAGLLPAALQLPRGARRA